MYITWMVFSGEGEGKNRSEKVQGRRSIITGHKIGIGKKWYRKQFKELIRTTHGHELREG